MKKRASEKQIGVRVGIPAFFALELEDAWRHTGGAHRALAFPDFCGLLIGLGYEAYRKAARSTEPEEEEEGSQEVDFWSFDPDAPPPRRRVGV